MVFFCYYGKMKLISLLTGIFLATISPLLSQEYQFSENIIEALQRGDYLFRQGKLEDAKIEYENVLMMDESSVKGLTGLFQVQLKLSKLPEARDSLDNIKRFSVNQKLIRTLSQQLENAERIADQKALESFESFQMEDFETATSPSKTEKKEIQRNPLTPGAQRIQRLSTKTPQGKFAKAIQLHKKRFTAQAIPLFMEALMEDPNLLFANDHGLLSQSRDFYLKALNADPRNVQYMFLLAWIWEQYSNPDEAKKLYERILKTAKKNSQEYLVSKGKLKLIVEEEQRVAQARALEEERIQKDASRYKKLQIANGKYSGYAKDEYQSKGKQFLEEKNIPEAIIHLQGATRVDPNNPETHYYYAMAQVESAFNGNENGFSIAKRELETTLNLNPGPDLRRKAEELLNTLDVEEQNAKNPAPTEF